MHVPRMFYQRSSSDKVIFYLVDMITSPNFQIASKFLKLVWFGCKIYIVCVKIRFKAIYHLQIGENLHFLLPPLNFRLYTGCPLDQTVRKYIGIT